MAGPMSGLYLSISFSLYIGHNLKLDDQALLENMVLIVSYY